MRCKGSSLNHTGVNLAQHAHEGRIADTLSVRSPNPPIWTPLALLLTSSLVFWCTGLDEAWARHFWSPTEGWFLKGHAIVRFLYQYGTWPALFVGGAGALVCLASWATGRWGEWRPLGLFLALLLAIGPGLVVNLIFKDHFGRARPVQTLEFGGKQSFSPLGVPAQSPGSKSFPCGHASMGFYWLGLFVFFWNQRRELAWGFCAVALTHGALMGLIRMAQGGHWLSDVLWSGGFVYLTAWLLQRTFRQFHATT